MAPRGKGKGQGRWRVQPLTPLAEGPVDPSAQGLEEEDLDYDEEYELSVGAGKRRGSGGAASSSWRLLVRTFAPIHGKGGGKKSRPDLRLTIGVLGCPLAPVSPPLAVDPVALQQSLALSLGKTASPNDPASSSCASTYILRQYLAATGWSKLDKPIKNSYTSGTVRMAYLGTEVAQPGGSGFKPSSSNKTSGGETGRFLLWQMFPAMWSMELALGGCKVAAGSDGGTTWRHVPWLGLHAARGAPQRPPRRVLQGLDPAAIAGVFLRAQCVGERRAVGPDQEPCFVLRVSADGESIAGRSEGPAEVIRHALQGYFSHRTGLLVYLEDSQLTRVQAPVAPTVYWETTIATTVTDYRSVERPGGGSVMVAHRGRSAGTVFRFGDGDEGAGARSRSRMIEEWAIDDVVFDVPGLSADYFIPPAAVSS